MLGVTDGSFMDGPGADPEARLSAAQRTELLRSLRPELYDRILRDIRDMLRDAYREAWNAPYMREVCGCVGVCGCVWVCGCSALTMPA